MGRRMVMAGRWLLAWLLGLAWLGDAAASRLEEAAAGLVGTPPRSITVVLDDNYPPYVYRDADGQLQGILKDIWGLWEKRTGIPVNLIATEWSKAQAIMRAGGADVIDTIFVTESRRQAYDFSAPYARIPVPIFFHKAVSGGIVGPESVKGFTLGVKEGDACVDMMLDHGQTSFKQYRSYEALARGAAAGEVQVFCIDEPPGLFLLYRLGVDRDFRHSPPIYEGQFHWAVAKGRTALKQTLEEGFAKISAEERAAIESKWLGESLPLRAAPRLAQYGGYAVLLAGLVALALFAWNRSLRRRVEARTDELRQTLDALQEASRQKEQASQQPR